MYVEVSQMLNWQKRYVLDLTSLPSRQTQKKEKTLTNMRVFLMVQNAELYIENSANALLHDHEDKVKNPQNPTTQEDTDDAGNDLYAQRPFPNRHSVE